MLRTCLRSALLLIGLLLPAAAHAQVVMAPRAGEPVLHVLNPDGSTSTFFAYDPAFTGGVRVALGDVNGDGIADIITGAGPTGGPHVKVFSGADLSLLASFYAYDPAFSGGIFVAAGDVNGDGRADIITGAGPGGSPQVRVFSGADLSELASFYAYSPGFTGGIFVAAGDVNGDGLTDIITGAGPGGGPHVRVFSGADLSDLASFYAFDPSFPGGVSVASLDVNGDGLADIITGAGAGGGPQVRVFSGADLSDLANFYAYDPSFPGGVSVGAADFDGDGQPELVTGAGPGGGPHVRVFRTSDFAELASFYAFDPAFAGGVFIGSLPGAGAGLRFTSVAATTFTVALPGIFTVTTMGAPTPTITVAGPLPAGVAFVDAGNGTGTLTTPLVVAGSGGVYPLTFTATNSVGSTTQAFTLTVQDRATFTSPAAATFTVGTPGTFAVTTATPAGSPTPTLAVSVLPAGLTFVDNGNGTGTLAGTAAAGTGGLATVVITATNSAGTTTQSLMLTLNQGASFTSASTTTFTMGSLGTFTVTSAGTPTPALSVTGALPAVVTFVDNGNGTATLSGTPAAGTGGTYPLTLTATNSSGTATQSFTLTVNQAPAITSASAATFTTNALGTFTVSTTGFPHPAITRTGATLPTGVTWVDNGDGTGTLSGTPAAGTNGTYALIFTATGVGPAAVQNFTLTVSGGPAITSAASATFLLNTAGTTFQVVMTGNPAPTVSVTAGVLPTGLTLSSAGLLSGTPTQSGSFPVTLTATNGTLPNATQAFTVLVNAPPAITSANATTFTVGSAGSFNVVMTGFPAPTVSVTAGTLPGGITLSPAGVLSGTPDPGTGGVHNVTFTATNGIGANAVQAFTLTVNGAPSITSASTTTFTVGTPGSFTVTATGSPTPALSVSGSLPAGVTFLDNGNGTGTLSGPPGAGTSGTYALTFTASNGVLPNGTQAFTLSVNGAPAITSAASTTFTAGTAGSFTVTTSGFPLPTLAIGGVALPSGVTFVDNGNGTATLSGPPAAGTGGTYAISFTATNIVGASAPQAFTLTVNQAPAITSANTASFTVGTPGTFTVTTTGFPAPAISRTGVALPSGVTFTDNGNGTGTLAGMPAAGTAGSYAFTFTATNSTPPSAGQAFTLTVQQPPAITSANSDTFTVGTADSFTVTTTGFPAPSVSQTGALPAGVMFTPATRVLGGTATQTGVFPLVFTATNGIPPDATQNFTLNVVCPAITVSPATMTDGLYQVAYAGVTFTQTGSTGSSFTWSAIGLPAGLTISATTGVVSGTPTNTVLNGAVSVTATDNFGCTGTRSTTITVRPSTDNENYIGGVGNTQYVVGAAVPSTPHVLNLDANQVNVKIGDNGPGALSVTFPATSPFGTITEGTTDGTFIYTPNLNFAGPSDSFTYTLTDGNGVTNTGTVTINLSNLVWYVNSSGGNGDGRSHNPFNTLASASTASGANSVIYVHTGAATTPGNLTMDVGQILRGQGGSVPFTLNGLTIPQGTAPTLTGTVTLGNATQVVAVNFTPTGIPALVSNGTTAVTIDTVNVTGGTNALSLTNATGVVNVTNSSFTNATGAEVLISGGTANVNIGATISSNAGRSIDIQNRTGGTVGFTGPITDTGQGILLNANTGSTITFSGGLALTTGANAAFTATGGGTVSATQNNTTIVNTITTTTGTALNVANTNLGASGLTFRSISSSGGSSNGIILDTTGSSGGLTVTGDGSNTSVGGNSSGGTITGKSGSDGSTTTGSGIYLNSTANVILRRMTINGTNQNFGIRGVNVNGFTMEYTTVSGSNGDNAGIDEGSANFDNLTGAAAITSSVIEGGFEDNLNVVNTSGTLNRLVITGSTFGFNDTVNGNNNILIESQNAGTTLNFTIQSSTIKGARADWINASNNSTSSMNAIIGGSGALGNTFDNLGTNAHPGAAAGGNRVVLGSIGTLTFDVNNNSLKGSKGEAIRVRSTAAGATTGSATGYVRNNVIGIQGTANSGSSEGSGIFAFGDGGSDMTIVITGNTVHQYNNHGIRMDFGDEINDGSVFNATVTGNTVSTPGTINTDFNAISLNHGTVGATDNFTSCVDIGANSVSGGGSGSIPPNNADIRLRQRQSTTVRLPGYGGANNNDAAVVSYLTGRNTLSTAAASNTVPTGGGFIGGGACTLPPF